MIRAFFLFLSVLLFSCKNDKKIKVVAINTKPPVVSPQKPDTLYKPLHIKVSKNDSLTIKRFYYDIKNLNKYYEEILRNGKQVYLDTGHEFIYESKYNRVINSHGKVLLFLESDGRPNFNLISAYAVQKNTISFIADCTYNDKNQGGGPPPFTDIDHDGFLEYGGFDINEVPEHPDSIYYNPSKFYEIRNGVVKFDNLLARKADKKENGIHLSNFMDKSGNCCKIIKKPTPKLKNKINKHKN